MEVKFEEAQATGNCTAKDQRRARKTQGEGRDTHTERDPSLVISRDDCHVFSVSSGL